MPFICQTRTDIPEATLQVLDLRPNTSQRSLIYEPPPQTKYLRRLQNDSVAVASSVTLGTYKGVAAWLVDTIEDTGDGGALTSAEANTIAAALVARLDSGADMDEASVNTVVQATVAASGIGLGASVGTLTELLKIFAGAEYVVPVGTAADAGAGNYKGSAAGAFVVGQYRATYSAGDLNISLGEGDLSVLTSATFSYSGTTGAACVVLDDDGTVL